MAIKKSQLYSKLWKSCDKLRGGMDASLYKDYILTLLFVKYVTDRFKGDKFGEIIVPNGGSFDDMLAAREHKNIGEEIDKIIAKLAGANDLKGVIDVAQFNDEEKLGKGKEMVDKLTELINIFKDLNFGKNRAGDDDILGDAYEYLMQNFAAESGKSKGQFYTPAEVSRVMAQLIGINHSTSANDTLYDPACGSGSLLIRAASEAPYGVSIFGQEKDLPTTGLAKMNLVLHNLASGQIYNDNTLAKPYFKDEKAGANSTILRRFKYCVANPPFSLKEWRDGFEEDSTGDIYGRFTGYGMPPDKNGDYAWLLHLIKSLDKNGCGAIILPHGVLFRGNAEATIREKIIKRGYIKGIIGLPVNLFYGTGIPACIIVLDKSEAETRKSIFMIDASKGFIKDGNKNRLREQDIHKIITVFNSGLPLEKYSRDVPYSEIETNEYNLNIPRYIDISEDEDIQNIEAHLKGGIPETDIDELSKYWDVYPHLRNVLFKPFSRDGFVQLKIAPDIVRDTIFTFSEFEKHAKSVDKAFKEWMKRCNSSFLGLNKMQSPKKLVVKWGGDMLECFSQIHLLDKYDVYQQFMVYWQDTMQDDTYAICYDGWEAGREIEIEYNEQKNTNHRQKIKEPKEIGYEGRVIPKRLIIKNFLQNMQDALDKFLADRNEIIRRQEEMIEEHGFDDGVLFEFIEDSKIKNTELRAYCKELKKKAPKSEEYKIVAEFVNLLDQESTWNKYIKTAMANLDIAIKKQYDELSLDKIKDLIINQKWRYDIFDKIDAVYSAISHQLANRVIELANRYKDTLPNLTEQTAKMESSVSIWLKKMGFEL